MGLYRAFFAFYEALFTKTCAHAHIQYSGVQGGGPSVQYCPDCGDPVKLVWVLLRCRGCGVKRTPQRHFNGSVKSKELFCRHCGADGVRQVKRSQIETHELEYAVLMLEVDHHEDDFSRPSPPTKPVHPLPMSDPNVVDGQVIKRRVYTGTKRNPWQFLLLPTTS